MRVLSLNPDRSAAIRTGKRGEEDRYGGEINMGDVNRENLKQLPAFWLGWLST